MREILASTADSHSDSNGLIDVIKILKNVLCSRAHVLRKALRVSILQCAPQHVMFLCIFLKDLMLSAHVLMSLRILLSSCASVSQHLMLFIVLYLYIRIVFSKVACGSKFSLYVRSWLKVASRTQLCSHA